MIDNIACLAILFSKSLLLMMHLKGLRMAHIFANSARFARVQCPSLPRAALAMLLLFACAGVHAQDAAPASLSGRAAKALALNDAQFVSQSVPASMAPGGAYNVAVTMKNTGSATWPAGGAYLLGSQNPQDNARWGGARAALGAAVQPGGQGTFSFQVTAPATPGSYGFQWRMVQEFVTWFGPLTPNVAVTVGGATPRNDAQVTAQSAPAQMTAGKSYNVSVTVKNTGGTTWKSADAYVLGAQNPQDNRLWNASGRVTLGATVAPGQQYTFSFPVVAPAPGAYSMQWRMLREGAGWFGGTSSSPVTVPGAVGGDIVTYIHTDALGSPVARSDAAGNIISRTRYEPYGGTAGGVTPTIGFTGHVNDADTGLVYMQQRYYDPVAGRFLSIDPVTTDANSGLSFNRYSYANNSPYRYIDPDGRDAAEKFVEQHRKDMETGKGKIYEPLMPVAVGVVGAAAVASVVVVGPPLLAATQSLLAPAVVIPVAKELSKQELKSIGSLAKQMAKHEAKNEKFMANPTVRPGMENLPKATVEKQQAQRVMDIKVEIQRNHIDPILDLLGM
jgi:RHS repeat-associated protein